MTELSFVGGVGLGVGFQMSTPDDGGDPAPVPDDDPPTTPIPIQRRRSLRTWWISLGALALVVVVLAAGYTFVRYLVNRGSYGEGQAAYERADCREAVGRFDDVINSWQLVEVGDEVRRAQERKAECLVFQDAVTRQDDGDEPGALAAYADFLNFRPSSPLTDAARGRVATLFERPEVGKLASTDSCDTLSVLREEKLLPAPATPTFYAACGRAYLGAGDTVQAIATYLPLFRDFGGDKAATDAEAEMLKDPRWCGDLARFRDDATLSARQDLFPGLLSTCAREPALGDEEAIGLAEEFLERFRGHRFTAEVMDTFAKRVNQQVRSDGRSKELGPAETTASPGGGEAVLLVFNDSPEPLRLAFTGPEPWVEDIEPCATCTVKPATDTNRFCEEKGPSRRILLAPGEYDVALTHPDQASSTRSGFVHWRLDAGKEYFGCWVTIEGEG